MPQPRSRIVDYTAYLVVRLAVCIVQALSWPAALGLARLIARLGFRFARRHREIAEENLRFAFPDLSPAEISRLIYSSFEHFAVMVIEIIRLPRLLHAHNASDVLKYAHPDDYGRAMQWVNSGRPLMILSGHFGNWEILSYVMGLAGFRGNVIARRLDNPYLDRYLHQFRRKTGQVLLDKNDDQKILNALSHGGALGMAGDQDAGRRGVYVDFLGRPASTFKSIALLSLEYSAPIMVFGSARVGSPMKYRLYLEDVILPEDYARDVDAMRNITQRYSDALARMIRRHPEQYFWVHRRWKHQPQPKKRKLAA